MLERSHACYESLPNHSFGLVSGFDLQTCPTEWTKPTYNRTPFHFDSSSLGLPFPRKRKHKNVIVHHCRRLSPKYDISSSAHFGWRYGHEHITIINACRWNGDTFDMCVWREGMGRRTIIQCIQRLLSSALCGLSGEEGWEAWQGCVFIENSTQVCCILCMGLDWLCDAAFWY
jgi:hypothetical protein